LIHGLAADFCRGSKSDLIQLILKESGLKVATQDYEYHSAGNVHRGRNVYGVIQAPRGDGTEAIVLVAAWKTIDEEPNLNGVALALTLARYFKSLPPFSHDSAGPFYFKSAMLTLFSAQDGLSGQRM
jgi:hypothetical protein